MKVLEWLAERWLQHGFGVVVIIALAGVFQWIETSLLRWDPTSTIEIAVAMFGLWIISWILYLSMGVEE